MNLVYLLPGLDALQLPFVFPSNRTVGIRGTFTADKGTGAQGL